MTNGLEAKTPIGSIKAKGEVAIQAALVIILLIGIGTSHWVLSQDLQKRDKTIIEALEASLKAEQEYHKEMIRLVSANNASTEQQKIILLLSPEDRKKVLDELLRKRIVEGIDGPSLMKNGK
jgi:uncharacterized protein HemX